MSSITPELRQLVREQQARTAAAFVEQNPEPVLDEIDRASAYLDEGWTPDGGLRPSSTIKMTYCMAMAAHEPDRMAAVEYVTRNLNEARRRWLAGFYANPFGDPVQRASA